MKIDIYEKSNPVIKEIIDILCDINFSYKRKTFYPIPDVFKPMHWFLMRFLYPYINFDFVKQRIKYSQSTDKSLLQFDNIDFFVPNLAFVFFCHIKYDYWAKQLCDWEFVDDSYYFWAFEEYYDHDTKMRKYFLNRYIMKNTHFYDLDTFGRRETLSTMRKFIYSKIKDAIDRDDLDEAIYACNSVPKCFIFDYEMTYIKINQIK